MRLNDSFVITEFIVLSVTLPNEKKMRRVPFYKSIHNPMLDIFTEQYKR
jgi:hypothetical protein